MIGTGREARAQLRALACVRDFKKVRAYSRDAEKRRQFAAEMSESLSLAVEPAESAEECVRGADVIVTITNANDPVFDGSWLADGAFVCGVGATGPYRRELDETTVKRASTVVVESLSSAVNECGDLVYAANRGSLQWNTVRELKDIVSGLIPARRRPEDITLFDTIGTGAEDVAVAAHVLKLARSKGIGTELPVPDPVRFGGRTGRQSSAGVS